MTGAQLSISLIAEHRLSSLSGTAGTYRSNDSVATGYTLVKLPRLNSNQQPCDY